MSTYPQGTRVDGDAPKELVLSDGSRLCLESAIEDHGARWIHDADGRRQVVSAERARKMAGPEFPDYVAVRTRAEAEWLRALAQWAGAEAGRLDEELARA